MASAEVLLVQLVAVVVEGFPTPMEMVSVEVVAVVKVMVEHLQVDVPSRNVHHVR